MGIAGASMSPPSVVAVRDDTGTTYVSWSPTFGAMGYYVFAGATPDTLEPVGFSRVPAFRLPESTPSNYIGVAAVNPMGEVSEPRVVGVQGRGSCVATSSELTVSVSLQSCIGLGP